MVTEATKPLLCSMTK